MDVYRITGGRRIAGTARVRAAKNAVLPILAAALLAGEPVAVLNCPRIADVDNMLAILGTLGCRWKREGAEVSIDAADASGWEMPRHLSKSLSSSIFILGSILGRFRRAGVSYPVGCEIGKRPIDLNL